MTTFYVKDKNDVLRPSLGDVGGETIVRPDYDEKLFGYHHLYREGFSDLNVAASTFSVNFSVVPSGYLWIIHILGIIPEQANASKIRFRVFDGSLIHELKTVVSYSAGASILCETPFILTAGDKVQILVANPSLNDDFQSNIFGYQMKLP